MCSLCLLTLLSEFRKLGFRLEIGFAFVAGFGSGWDSLATLAPRYIGHCSRNRLEYKTKGIYA